MTALELLEYLDYGQSKKYLDCLLGYEEHMGWLDHDGSMHRKYIELIEQYGARTPTSRRILEKLC